MSNSSSRRSVWRLVLKIIITVATAIGGAVSYTHLDVYKRQEQVRFQSHRTGAHALRATDTGLCFPALGFLPVHNQDAGTALRLSLIHI